MDQQVKERLDGIEGKLDTLIERLDQAERRLGAFLTGPGKAFAKMLGLKG